MGKIDLNLIKDYHEAIEKVKEFKEFMKIIFDDDDIAIISPIFDKFIEVSEKKINAIKELTKK